MKIVREPDISKNGPCQFEFVVDSSVVCAYKHRGSSSSSSSSSSTGPASSSSSSSSHAPVIPTVCSHIAPSYQAPYDLSTSNTISTSSVNFPSGEYYIKPCGQFIVTNQNYQLTSHQFDLSALTWLQPHMWFIDSQPHSFSLSCFHVLRCCWHNQLVSIFSWSTTMVRYESQQHRHCSVVSSHIDDHSHACWLSMIVV